MIFKVFKFLILQIIINSNLYAMNKIETLCSRLEQATCNKTTKMDNQSDVINSDDKILQTLEMSNEAVKYSRDLQEFKEYWIDFLRFIKEDRLTSERFLSEPENVVRNNEILSKLKITVKELKILQKEINTLIAKSTSKAIIGSRDHIRELDIQISILRDYKKELITQSIWLNHEDLDELILKGNDEDLKNILIDNISSVLLSIRKTNTEIFIANNKENERQQDGIFGINGNLSLKTTNQIISRAFSSWPEKNEQEKKLWCNIAKKYQFTSDRYRNLNSTINGTLLLASILPTPIALSLRTNRLLTIARGISSSSSKLFTTKLVADYINESKSCNQYQQEYSLNPSEEKLNNWDNCISKAEMLKYQTMLSFIPITVISKMPLFKSKIASLSRAENIQPKVYKTQESFERAIKQNAIDIGSGAKVASISVSPTGKVITQINTRRAQMLGNTDVDSFLYEYIEQTGNIYAKKLNLKPSEISSFTTSGKEVLDRGYVIVKTDKLPQAIGNNFEGGMILTSSKSMSEKLPIEKTVSGFNAPRVNLAGGRQGETIEVTRVFSTHQDDFKKMLHAQLLTARENSDVVNLVFYSSKANSIGFRRSGVKATKHSEVNSGRDIVMTIDQKQISQTIATLEKKLEKAEPKLGM